ncbi:hypothetical protein RB595_010211 [Gaeumannomyces hyphopodioides]
MMHITSLASGCFENMWLWAADQMIDDTDPVDANNTMVQNSVYVARSLLVESVSPTWLYGTSSEHAVYYQYNFHGAKNIFAGMIQTDPPYYQPTPQPPAPFESVVGVLPGNSDYTRDPTNEFNGCDESWAVIITECANIFVVLMLLKDNHSGVRIQHLITIGAKYIAVMNGVAIKALDYLDVESYPRWSQISVLDVANDGELAEKLWINPSIWSMEQPAFTCVPPCLVMLPPWTKATRVVEYPRMTISEGDWATTLTNQPITITQMHFEIVTLTAGGRRSQRRQEAHRPGLFRLLAHPGHHPVMAHPDMPSPTAGGSWPKRALSPQIGTNDSPQVPSCNWNGSWDPLCQQNGDWNYDQMGPPPDDEEADKGDFYGDCATATADLRQCVCGGGPGPESGPLKRRRGIDCSTTTSSTTTQPPPTPTYKVGDPSINTKHCYDSGQPANNAQMAGAANSFCCELGKAGELLHNEGIVDWRRMGGRTSRTPTANGPSRS